MVKKLSAGITVLHRYALQGSTPSTPAAGHSGTFFKNDGFYFLDQSGNVYKIRMEEESIFIPAFQMWPSTTAGCAPLAQIESATNDQNNKVLDFDQTTQEHAEFSLMLPYRWNASTISFRTAWTASAGTAGNVNWNLQALSYPNSGAIDTAWGTAVASDDSFITLLDVHYSPQSAALTIGNTPALGEMIQFRIFRDVANDTFDADARLLGVQLFYN